MKVQVELTEIELPNFGEAIVEPIIEAAEYETRLQALWERVALRGLDAVVVYADREHAANMAYLTGFDPRFEEALLVLASPSQPYLLVGNEDWAYVEISPLKLERRLYQPFSLMGQDRSKSKKLDDLLHEALGPSRQIGVIDWKYFSDEPTWLNAPAYIVDALRRVTGWAPTNITDLTMNPQDGLRANNSVDQLACFEYAATTATNALRRILWNLQPGLTEYEAMANARLNGMPLSCHPMLSTGPRAAMGLGSPSARKMAQGDPITCAIGVWGALSARAGFLVHAAAELPATIQDYLERLAKPYFAAIVEWYRTVGIGVQGEELHAVIRRHLGDPFFGVALNPGHLIHLDEWLNSPIYQGSKIPLQSGMALQVDVIPATNSPYFSTNIEDGIALADDALRREFARRWPEAWARIQARRTFMAEKLGIDLKPEVLPFSNLAAYLPPFLLAPNMALRVH